jgi:hypothetical protein
MTQMMDLPDNQDDGPEKLYCNGDAVGSRIITARRRVVDNGSQEQTDRNGELVASYDHTSDPFWRCLGLVHGDYA